MNDLLSISKITLLLTGISSFLLTKPPKPYLVNCAFSESKPDPCEKCAQIWPTYAPNWVSTPNAGPCVANGFDANLSASFIYWTAREDHLNFSYQESVQGISSGTTVTSKSDVKHLEWNFRPGFKIAVGYLYDHDGWDVLGEYTSLRVRDTKKSLSVNDLSTQRIQGIWPFSINIDDPINVQALWHLDFNVVDLELGRNFLISRYLKLRPQFGLKATWQNQHYHLAALGLVENIPITAIDKHELEYWGVGIRTGLDTAWHFIRCFSLYGEVAASLLWECFEAEEKTEIVPLEVNDAEPLTALYVGNSIRATRPVIELNLGLRWETWFCRERYHFSIEAGWEEQWWSDQNQLFDAYQETRQGDLSLHGLTLKARIDF